MQPQESTFSKAFLRKLLQSIFQQIKKRKTKKRDPTQKKAKTISRMIVERNFRMYSSIQEIITEHLLCIKHCSGRHRGHLVQVEEWNSRNRKADLSYQHDL